MTKIPHLTTASTGPLHKLERLFLEKQVDIEAWLRLQWQQTPAPLNSSVDVRNAGFKVAPVDTNLFPAGFNNLNTEFMALCTQAASYSLESHFPGIKRILIIPENNTRNQFYLFSLITLRNILQQAGYEVQVGSLLPDLPADGLLAKLDDGQEILLQTLDRINDNLQVGDFIPEVIWLNNDLSDGVPEILEGIQQAIVPPPALGWANRLKSGHFGYYAQVANEFARLVDIDPWLIDPYFATCSAVDFKRREGEACLVSAVNKVLTKISEKYREYDIHHKPFVVVKADAGTYGMGVMMVHDAEQLKNLNRKERTRMSASKGSQSIGKVIIQEGIYTFETLDDATAEPVVYMIDSHVVGGFYRVHKGRGDNENLNAPGMHFEPLAFAKSCNVALPSCKPEDCDNRFYTYGVVGRLALLAAAREWRDVLTGNKL